MITWAVVLSLEFAVIELCTFEKSSLIGLVLTCWVIDNDTFTEYVQQIGMFRNSQGHRSPKVNKPNHHSNRFHKFVAFYILKWTPLNSLSEYCLFRLLGLIMRRHLQLVKCYETQVMTHTWIITYESHSMIDSRVLSAKSITWPLVWKGKIVCIVMNHHRIHGLWVIIGSADYESSVLSGFDLISSSRDEICFW